MTSPNPANARAQAGAPGQHQGSQPPQAQPEAQTSSARPLRCHGAHVSGLFFVWLLNPWHLMNLFQGNFESLLGFPGLLLGVWVVLWLLRRWMALLRRLSFFGMFYGVAWCIVLFSTVRTWSRIL